MGKNPKLCVGCRTSDTCWVGGGTSGVDDPEDVSVGMVDIIEETGPHLASKDTYL